MEDKWGVMENKDMFDPIMMDWMTGYPFHVVLARAVRWDGCPGCQVGLLVPSSQVGMDAQVPQSVIDGS